MTRKRQRARTKAKVAIKSPKEDYLAFDSGNDSPPAEEGTQPWKEAVKAHHCAESIKAWKFYQACVLERFHWFVDRRRRTIAEEYANRIAKAWLHSVPSVISTSTAEIEAAMLEELEEVDQEERVANAIFRGNIEALDMGKSMDELPLIDTRVTFDQVTKFIAEYTSEVQEVDLEKDDMNLSFSNSTSSQDSGLLLHEQLGSMVLLSADIWKTDGDDIWKPDGDDIWKPDADIFNGSFTVDQFYQPQLGVQIADAEMVLPEIKPAAFASAATPGETAWQPTPAGTETTPAGTETTPAGTETTPAEGVKSESMPAEYTTSARTQLSETIPTDITSTKVTPDATTVLESSTESSFVKYQPSIADEDSAIKAVVYSQALPAQTQEIGSNPLTKLKDSLSQMSTEFQACTAQLCQPHAPDVPTVNPSLHAPGASTATNSFPVSLPKVEVVADAVGSLKNDAMNVDEENGGKGRSTTKVSQPETNKDNNKSTKAPVMFVDQKNVGAKDQEMVKGILFSWTDESDAEAKMQEPASADTVNVDTAATAKPSKPLLSFAAVAASAASIKVFPAKAGNATVEVDSNAVFSTKKPTRKFSKSSSLNKTSMCWAYKETKKCPWGAECIFAHGKSELQPIPKWFGKEQAAKVNSQKVEEAPHKEPCNDHFCRWRRQYLLRKTDICKLNASNRCPNSAEKCRFAHGAAELKPLPKLELCLLFQRSKCNLKSTECVYAHHPSELRNKKRKKVKKEAGNADTSVLSSSPHGRLRTISETSTGSHDSSWSVVVGGERVRTISGTSLHSNSSQGMRDLEEFDWLAWNSQSEVPAEEELDDSWNEEECVICSNEFTLEKPKHVLECEHDNFHKKCITQWFTRRKTCPMCNNPSDPDYQYEDEQWHLE